MLSILVGREAEVLESATTMDIRPEKPICVA